MCVKIFSEKAQKVLTFLQSTPRVDMTAAELAEMLDIPKRSMTGTLNALQNKGLIDRIETKVADEKVVKFIRLTPEGKQADPTAEK